MQNLVEGRSLKEWQDKFCSTTKVYAYCMDAAGEPITEMSGSEGDRDRLRQIVSEEQINNIYKRMVEDGLEEQTVEDTPVPGVRLAGICVRSDRTVEMVWAVCGILTDTEPEDGGREPYGGEESGGGQESYRGEESGGGQELCGAQEPYGRQKPQADFAWQVSETQFYHALDLLRDTFRAFSRLKYSALTAEAESRRSRYSEQEMGMALRRNEAIAKVVQLLESDCAIEEIMAEVLKILGTYLDISTACLCRVHSDAGQMDVVSEWQKEKVASCFDRTRNLPCPGLLKNEKFIVLSSDTALSAQEQAGVDLFGAKALIVAPVIINGRANMYACFCESGRERKWQIEEIRFLNDAVKLLQSILVKRIQKNSLASSYATLETILDNVGSSIYVRDMQTREVLFTNRSLRNNFVQEIRQQRLDLLFEAGVTQGESRGNYEVEYKEKERWYDLYYTDIIWVDGRAVTLFAIYDITEKKVYQQRIEQQAYTDFLTGLYNRLCCERDLARHIDGAKREGTKGALLYLDLDDFKHINDGLGHQYGDVLLKSISHSLQKVDSIENTCYRMGGDEFVIIIPPESYERFERIISEIRKIFSRPWFLKDADYYCTMSMGVVTFPEGGESVHELIQKADIAMYEAKKHGKNRVSLYSDNIHSASGRRLDMEKNMRDAAVSGCREFEVYFQPIMDLQLPGTPCTGAEALVRWNSAELGFIPPSEFIPLAEYLGLINPIGNYVLEESCRHCKEWNEKGYPGYKVNVNLSVVQLLQPDIVEVVAKTIKDTGINPRNLTLEVTESLAINDMERMKMILERIKKLGVRIALDDFGTGYSSLNHIREIPFDVIKVDQSFVKDLAEDAYSQSFIRMVAELADAIGVSICVEGIETREQYKVLEGMKVRLIQGYYFDRPMPLADFEKKYLTCRAPEPEEAAAKEKPAVKKASVAEKTPVTGTTKKVSAVNKASVAEGKP